MMKLRERIRSGGLGTIMHVEATMTFPNALLLNPSNGVQTKTKRRSEDSHRWVFTRSTG